MIYYNNYFVFRVFQGSEFIPASLELDICSKRVNKFVTKFRTRTMNPRRGQFRIFTYIITIWNYSS